MTPWAAKHGITFAYSSHDAPVRYRPVFIAVRSR